jgi:hypothetical protein
MCQDAVMGDFWTGVASGLIGAMIGGLFTAYAARAQVKVALRAAQMQMQAAMDAARMQVESANEQHRKQQLSLARQQAVAEYVRLMGDIIAFWFAMGDRHHESCGRAATVENCGEPDDSLQYAIRLSNECDRVEAMNYRTLPPAFSTYLAEAQSTLPKYRKDWLLKLGLESPAYDGSACLVERYADKAVESVEGAMGSLQRLARDAPLE